MDLQSLMSGIAVVIDDKLDRQQSISADSNYDLIGDIVTRFEAEWSTPFYRSSEMPDDRVWDNLLKTASFVLLDWRLWEHNAAELEADGVERNLEFLQRAKDYSVPVLIFTNEDPDDIAYKMEHLYEGDSLKRSFVFIQPKSELLVNGSLNLDAVETWMRKNASVYTLKTWDYVLDIARRDLFGAMYARSPDWPKVFWRESLKDGVDPSAALTDLINDSLRGRMQPNVFENEILGIDINNTQVPREDLHALLSATSFLDTVPDDELRCGDLFSADDDTFLINIRPDCDCIPRGELTLDEVDLYCIEGTAMEPAELRKKYRSRGGYLMERVNQAIVFAAGDGKSVDFDFRQLRIEKFKKWKNHRIGRVLHPYVTRIQQRYALFLQRQGLPRIPREAILPALGGT